MCDVKFVAAEDCCVRICHFFVSSFLFPAENPPSLTCARFCLTWNARKGSAILNHGTRRCTTKERVGSRIQQCRNTFEIDALLQSVKRIAAASLREPCAGKVEAKKSQFETLQGIRRRYQAVYFEYALILLDNMLTPAHAQQQLWNGDFPSFKAGRYDYITAPPTTTVEWCSPGT